MELLDILDGNGNKTGRVVERGKTMEKGEYHLVVIVCIKNSDGKVLISKRSPNKRGANKWETVAGAAITGEDSIHAAVREVKEELGIILDTEKGIFINRLKYDTKISWFADIWLFNKDIDISDVVYQKEEVCDAKWATKDEILDLIYNKEFFNGFVYLDSIFKSDLI